MKMKSKHHRVQKLSRRIGVGWTKRAVIDDVESFLERIIFRNFHKKVDPSGTKKSSFLDITITLKESSFDLE